MKKIFDSKWTAIDPKNKEKHFLVVKINYKESGKEVESIVLEAVYTKQHYTMSVDKLAKSGFWVQGWK